MQRCAEMQKHIVICYIIPQVELLSHLRSPYLLALIGYCSDNNNKLLVYEFMANGGLQEHLYPIGGKFLLKEKVVKLLSLLKMHFLTVPVV